MTGQQFRKSRDFPSNMNSDFKDVDSTDTKVSISLNTNYFSSDEIDIKTRGNELFVHGHHDYEGDYGPVMERDFERCYKFGADVDMSSIDNHMLRGGILLIEADKLAAFTP
jgi:HSP20 family molecular chaperone IbpA